MNMILGIDFDNTLVCYDGMFHKAAVERNLMPADGPRDKDGVRGWLIERGREEDFTLLQGEVYGPDLRNAPAYPGARECLAALKAKGATLRLISHKTPTPVLGRQHDLRAAAREWLEANGFLSPEVFSSADVFFENTMEAKAARIANSGCTHFIDDMERFLLRPDFPSGTKRLWFRPTGEERSREAAPELTAVSSWRAIAEALGAAV